MPDIACGLVKQLGREAAQLTKFVSFDKRGQIMVVAVIKPSPRYGDS